MGALGKRAALKLKQDFTEPLLLKSIDGVIQLAKEKKLYQGDKLDITELIHEVAQASGEQIQIEYKDIDPTISGGLRHENGIWMMVVNRRHNERRQRFTLAHELGHFIMHKEKNEAFEDYTFFRNNKMASIEYDANNFAADLLMLTEYVQNAVESGCRNIGELAERFGVSNAAMRLKIENMGYKIRDNG